MGWGAKIGFVLLSALEGGSLALALASFIIEYQQITAREGTAGYFAVSITLIGLFCGLVVGVITALAATSGFWKTQGYAVGILFALTLAGGVLLIWSDDRGPKLDGDSIVAEIELKCPRGWQPDNKAKFDGSFCWVQAVAADAPSRENPMYNGGLSLEEARQEDGRWIVPSAIDLRRTTSNRYLRMFMGRVTDVTIKIPLPRSPGAKYKEWSAWRTDGFLAQKDHPVQPGYEFRCRIQTDTEYKRAHPDKNSVTRAALLKTFDSMPADAPIAKWLPLFEDADGRPTANMPGDHPELKAVNAHAEQLSPLLRSTDRNVVRQAVYAAATLEHPPESIIEPLAHAGLRTIELAKESSAGALPGDPDLVAEDKAHQYFSSWSVAMDHAGDAAIPARRKVLEQIEPEVQSIPLIADQVRKDLAQVRLR
jgi:hypothetical protein